MPLYISSCALIIFVEKRSCCRESSYLPYHPLTKWGHHLGQTCANRDTYLHNCQYFFNNFQLNNYFLSIKIKMSRRNVHNFVMTISNWIILLCCVRKSQGEVCIKDFFFKEIYSGKAGAGP